MQIERGATTAAPDRKSRLRLKPAARTVAAFAAAMLAILFLAAIVMTPANAFKRSNFATPEQISAVRL